MTDQAISDAVEDQILMDHAVPLTGNHVNTVNGVVNLSGTVTNALNVTPEVGVGAVTLLGEVASLQARRAAADTARNTGG